MCGTLEFHAKRMATGWVRICHASSSILVLGIGTAIGVALYGAVYKNATTAVTAELCRTPTFDSRYHPLWVGAFALSLVLVNQARWRQAPVMVAIALAGYMVDYFLKPRLTEQPVLVKCLCGFTVGLLSRVYSRVGHGLAFAAMLPAIFVQVPDALVAQGSLYASVTDANANLKSTVTQDIMIMIYLGVEMFHIAVGTAVGILFLDVSGDLLGKLGRLVLGRRGGRIWA